MEEVLLTLYGLFWAGDNPIQAEECSHAGLACNLSCRTCDVGGTKEFKQSDEGYPTIFEASYHYTFKRFYVPLMHGMYSPVKCAHPKTQPVPYVNN
jgi:hypothetical protein